jgi:hypothetical protein
MKPKNSNAWVYFSVLIAALASLTSCDFPEEEYEEDDFFNNVEQISQLGN